MDFSFPQKQSRGKLHHVRAEELVLHAAAEFIVRESNATSLITATRAELSQRGDRAVVFVTIFPDEAKTTALDFLNRRADDFRDYLKAHSRMRDLPFVKFEEDYGEKNRQHLDDLGKQL
ncbi:MAG TPA: ribosome-binding factor A [Candidatus Paceibacterota bacterium]|nr:ribosome-binding factor A [Candidatus Paceibacterota bacterium]